MSWKRGLCERLWLHPEHCGGAVYCDHQERSGLWRGDLRLRLRPLSFENLLDYVFGFAMMAVESSNFCAGLVGLSFSWTMSVLWTTIYLLAIGFCWFLLFFVGFCWFLRGMCHQAGLLRLLDLLPRGLETQLCLIRVKAGWGKFHWCQSLAFVPFGFWHWETETVVRTWVWLQSVMSAQEYRRERERKKINLPLKVCCRSTQRWGLQTCLQTNSGDRSMAPTRVSTCYLFLVYEW